MDKKPEDDYKWYHDNVDHTPMHPHPEWVVDRCADRCDDQLPLFSQVGRGLQGNGFKIVAEEDNEHTWTILKGYEIDPHTGQETEKWRTDNINGGKLTHKFLYDPATNPKTFRIQFTLTRPNGLGWTDITPAIPYVWTDEPNTYVSSLFIKPVGDNPSWDEVVLSSTPHSIDETLLAIEKLIYPDGISREALHAPNVGDPNTVNLTYGKNGDIDCPTTAEEQGDIAAAKQQVLEHLHKDLGGGEGLPAVPDDLNLKPLKGDGGNKTVWDWIQYAIGKAEEHLHKDLYGGPSGEKSDYADIPNDLKPLVGDNGNATVWDWIQYAIEQATSPIVNPEQHSQTIDKFTPQGGQECDLYLCLVTPRAFSSNTAITPLAAIRANVVIEYFDVLPNVVLTIDIQNADVVDASDDSHKYYCDPKGLRIGTGEIAVMCYKNGSYYYPLNLRLIQLAERTKNQYLTYPGSDPEIQANTGFSWMGMLEGAQIVRDNPHGNGYIQVYPNNYGLEPTFSNQVTWNDQTVHTYYYGPWQIYTGLGNIAGSGDYRWSSKIATSETFLYIFNRSTGNLGPRVLLDYNRAYQVNYIQRKA